MPKAEILSIGWSTSSKFELKSNLLASRVKFLTDSAAWTATSMASRPWCP